MQKRISSLVVAVALVSSIIAPVIATAQSNPQGVGMQTNHATRISYLSVQAAVSIEEVDEYLDVFMEDYDVPTFRTCPVKNIGACRSVNNNDFITYRDTIAVFILEWAKYTPAFIQASGIEGIYFLMDLPYGGFTFSGDDNFYVSAAYGSQGSYPEYIQRVFHHEFFHLIDKKFPVNSDNDWAALNTPGFTYIGGAAYDALPVKSDHPQPGFVHSYSTVSADEDKAVLYEHMFFKSRAALLEGWAASDPYLTSKITYMQNQLKALDGSINSSYFSTMHDFDIDSVILPASSTIIPANDHASKALMVFENQTATLHGKRSRAVVFAGGTFKGTGEVSSIEARNGSRVAPGSSPGCLSTGNATLVSGSTFDIEIAGNTACTQYDRLNVSGFTILVGATLNVSFLNSFVPEVGDSYTIIENSSNNPIIGTTFNNLPEGATFTVGRATFQISYIGGTGNDISLEVTAVAPAPVIPADPASPSSPAGTADATTPTAPNTGMRPTLMNPLLIFAGTLVSSGILFWLSRKHKAYAS